MLIKLLKTLFLLWRNCLNYLSCWLFGPPSPPKFLNLYTDFYSQISDVKFSPDGKFIAVDGYSYSETPKYKFHLFDIVCKKKVDDLSISYNEKFMFTPDSRYLIVLISGPKMEIYSLKNKISRVASIEDKDLNALSMDISPDSRWILLTYKNEKLKVFDLETLSFVAEFKINGIFITNIFWLTKEKFITISKDSVNTKICKWSFDFNKSKSKNLSTRVNNSIAITLLSKHILAISYLFGFKLSPNKDKLLYSRNKSFELLDLKEISESSKLDFDKIASRDCNIVRGTSNFGNSSYNDAYCHDARFINNQLIISVDSEYNYKIWDAYTLQKLKNVRRPSEFQSLRTSPGRKILFLIEPSITIKGYQIPDLPYREFLGFDFYGSNFRNMLPWFKRITLTFLFCCQKHRERGKGCLANLPRDMRQLILTYVSYRPFHKRSLE